MTKNFFSGKILVFGSLNIDRTYTVDHFAAPGETMSADGMELFCGGKGFNQAVALARAGETVYFAGAVGNDGDMLLESLEREGVDTRFIKRTAGAGGHAVIQVNADGQNCIMLLAGANGEISREDADNVLSHFSAGDIIVLQNEISSLEYLIDSARKKGMTVVFNPSPYNEKIDELDLNKADILFVNEVEAAGIGKSGGYAEMLSAIHDKYPGVSVVLTLGEHGSAYMSAAGAITTCGTYGTHVVDTTAAGDTFTGYFLSAFLKSGNAAEALVFGAAASGIAVSRPGAYPSIPTAHEVQGVDAKDFSPFSG